MLNLALAQGSVEALEVGTNYPDGVSAGPGTYLRLKAASRAASDFRTAVGCRLLRCLLEIVEGTLLLRIRLNYLFDAFR
jgi:hypothetical protein